MALKSWLASFKAEVSSVSGVQAPVHGDLGRYATEMADVSGVSETGSMVGHDTVDTVAENQTYQAKPIIHAGCTDDTAETCKTIDTDAHAVNQLFSGDLLTVETTPKRLFRQPRPWLTARQLGSAKAYLLHHFNCRQCIAAGRRVSR